MIVAIIQARMTSSRLPGKVLADIAGKPSLQWMIERAGRAQRLDRLIVATTRNTDDDPVADLAARLGVDAFRGDERDVLGRYRGAAARAGAETIVRLTADCPMIDPDLIDQTIARFQQGDCDYASNARIRSFPDGLDVEVFSRAALDRAAETATHAYAREHVTPIINGSGPDRAQPPFNCADVVAPADFGHVRWTVDTAEDLARVRRLFALLPDGFGWLEALSAATREPALLGVTPLPNQLSALGRGHTKAAQTR